MVARFWVWLSAGVVTAGMSAAMLTGAGVAAADDGPSSDAGGSKTSETSKSAESQKDSPGSGVTGGRVSDGDATGARVSGGAPGARVSGGAPSTRVGARTPAAKTDDSKDAGRTGRGDNEKKPAEDSKKDDTAADQRAKGEKPSDAPTDDAAAQGAAAQSAAVQDAAVQDAAAQDAAIEEPATAEAATVEPATEEAATEETATRDAATEEVVSRSGSDRDRTAAQLSAAVAPNPTTDPSEEAATVRVEPEKKAVIDTEIDNSPVQVAAEERTMVALDKAVETTEEFAMRAVAFASAPPAANAVSVPPLTRLLDLVGTIVFDLYAVATRLIGGPPILPPNSTVTVQSRTLRIDCGCAPGEGTEVPVDWYFPEVKEGAPPPDRLIYLQHGFLASGPWYSHTAAALAEQTNSIVVAPSITSNFLASDGCWLGAAPMHQAIGNLFADDNPALAASLASTGYEGQLPQRVVLIGHSLGGGAVSGAAGYMSNDPDTADELAGVVLLDGVGMDGKMADSLREVPSTVPVYQLAAPKYLWNMFGVGSTALEQARPDAPFIGVTLVGGSHVDSMRGGNPLIQFAQQLVSGFSQPQNVAAAQILMVGWVNDMFAEEGDPRVGIYPVGDQQEISILTPAGTATAVLLPNSLTKPYLLNFLQPFISLGQGLFTFEPTCGEEAPSGSCAGSMAA